MLLSAEKITSYINPPSAQRSHLSSTFHIPQSDGRIRLQRNARTLTPTKAFVDPGPRERSNLCQIESGGSSSTWFHFASSCHIPQFDGLVPRPRRERVPPSGENATLRTEAARPLSVFILCPLAVSERQCFYKRVHLTTSLLLPRDPARRLCCCFSVRLDKQGLLQGLGIKK